MSPAQVAEFGEQTSPPITIIAGFWTGPGAGKTEFYPYLSTTRGQTDGQGNFMPFGTYVTNFAGTGGGYLGDPTKQNSVPPASYAPPRSGGSTVFYGNVLAANNFAWDANPVFKVASPPAANPPAANPAPPANAIALANSAIAAIKQAVPGSGL